MKLQTLHESHILSNQPYTILEMYGRICERYKSLLVENDFHAENHMFELGCRKE